MSDKRQVVAVRNPSDNTPLAVQLASGNGLLPADYDHVDLSYTGELLTLITFRKGGSNGETVASLSLTYKNKRLTSVTKT